MLPDYYGDERRAKRERLALAAMRYALAGLAGVLVGVAVALARR